MIPVTRSFLPDFGVYSDYLRGVWDRGHLTNHGPLVLQLEQELRSIFETPSFYFLSNGTVALQIAIKALELEGEIITTPFSYVATTSSIVWEQATPVFVDIDPETLAINPALIEAAITPKTQAILATHVYGIPCDVEAIKAIADRHGLKVIYDAAHAYGVGYKGKPLISYGDISTISFHATKIFHTVEGGGIVAADPQLAHRISYLRNFGHNGPEAFWGLGINGKNSEFHAAMGLSVLPHMATIIAARGALLRQYDEVLVAAAGGRVRRPVIPTGTVYNNAYYPVFFESEATLLKASAALQQADIFPRRYFYPALHKLPYIQPGIEMPVAEKAAATVLCLPLYVGLEPAVVEQISRIILNAIN